MIDIREHGGVFERNGKKLDGNTKEYDMTIVSSDVSIILPNMGSIGTANLGKKYVCGTYGNGSDNQTLPIYAIEAGTVTNSTTTFSNPDNFTIFVGNNGKEYALVSNYGYTKVIDLQTKAEIIQFNNSVNSATTRQAQTNKSCKNKDENGYYVGYGTGKNMFQVLDIVNKVVVKPAVNIPGIPSGLLDFVVIPNIGVIVLGVPSTATLNPTLPFYKVNTNTMTLTTSGRLPLPSPGYGNDPNTWRVMTATVSEEGKLLIAYQSVGNRMVTLMVINPVTMAIEKSTSFSGEWYPTALMDNKLVYKIVCNGNYICNIKKSDLTFLGGGVDNPNAGISSNQWNYGSETNYAYNGEYRLVGGGTAANLVRKKVFTI